MRPHLIWRCLARLWRPARRWNCWSRPDLLPLEAIHIATQNGALYLGESDQIGSIGAGKAADLVVIAGNPAQNIEDIENVQLVFKDGVGFDPVKLTQSVQGLVGQR